MKKIYTLILSAVFFSSLAAQNKYEIDFFIHDIDDTILYIGNYVGASRQIIDSLRIKKDGSFHWSSNPLPKGMYMVKDQKQKDMFSFMLDNSRTFSIEIYNTSEAVVTNCPENDAYMLYQKENNIYQRAMYYYRLEAQAHPENQDSLYKALRPVMDNFNKFQESFFKTYPNNFITVTSESMIQNVPTRFLEDGKIKQGMEKEYYYYYRKHYWDSFRFDDNRLLYSPYFINKFNAYISEATPQVADSVCSSLDNFVAVALHRKGVEYADYVLMWYLNRLPQMPFSFNELIYQHIVNKYENYLKGLVTQEDMDYHKDYLGKISKFFPGNIMPNIIAEDIDGKPQSLYSIKKPFTVLYFFSSTCESCLKNIDVLKELYRMNKDYYNFEIFSIDIEDDVEIAKARQRMDTYPWIVTYKDVSSLRDYGFILDHTPELYILDKDKRIINKTPMYEHVEKTMDTFLKNSSN